MEKKLKKEIFTQVLADEGTAAYTGLFDKQGHPVIVELEHCGNGSVLTVVRKELNIKERCEICGRYNDCTDCPIAEECDEITEEYDEDE